MGEIKPNRKVTSTEGVSIREYFDARINALDRATTLAANALEKRLGGMNEIRGVLQDQSATFMTRSEISSQLDAMKREIDKLRTFKDQQEGKASSTSVFIAYLLAIIGIVLSIVSIFFN